jgi:N,N'-diacetyllegionaminate synthase
MNNFSSQFKIEDRKVGCNSPVYIIAEAGISHFGDEDKAYKLVDMAVSAGADAVKFQVFDIDEMIVKSQSDWRGRLGSRQLPYDAFVRIQKYCAERGITFFATAHDDKSLDFLHDIDIPVYKIGSGELGNDQYFRKIAQYDKPIIFSTGMYHFKEIESVLNIFSNEGKCDIAALHCVTSYPTKPKDASLFNINKIREKYNVITGYSDHTEGYHLPLAAVALGAKIIEKHITLDFNIPNAQDWKVSCGPQNLSLFVQQVRDIEDALTLRDSGPTTEEQKSKLWATKSLALVKPMLKGDVIERNLLVAKRPGVGITPVDIDKIIGKRINANLEKDSILLWEHIQ